MPDISRDELLRRAKKSEPLERLDLRGFDLSKTDLHGAQFLRCDLEGANLKEANLAGASFRGSSLREAHLAGANLSGANLEAVDLDGAKLGGANLTGANLTRAHMDGTDLSGADLSKARASHALFVSANLGNATLHTTVLSHALFDEAYLGGIKATGADFTGADLRNANLEEADLSKAVLDHVRLHAAKLTRAQLGGASLCMADLTQAALKGADLKGADARHASARGAILDGADLSGAKVAGFIGTGSPVENVTVSWLDTSAMGDATERTSNGQIPSLLSGMQAEARSAGERYFGQGDTIRDAQLELVAGALATIDGLMERCSITLGEGTRLVIGATGALVDCNVEGPGEILVHGAFFERKSPGIIGPRRLVVSQTGSLAAVVRQASDATQFAFERGCKLRIKILNQAA